MLHKSGPQQMREHIDKCTPLLETYSKLSQFFSKQTFNHWREIIDGGQHYYLEFFQQDYPSMTCESRIKVKMTLKNVKEQGQC